MNIPTKLLSLAAPLALLSVASLSAATIWTGASSNDWNTAGNWDNGVPIEATEPAIVALDGAVADISAASSSGAIRISGNGTVAPTLNITQNLTMGNNTLTVGGLDGAGAAAAGYQGVVNHTEGILTSTNGNDVRIAAGGGTATGTSSYNFGGLSGSAPSLILSGSTSSDITLGNGTGETGNLNLSGFGTIDISGRLTPGLSGTGNISVVGGNLSIDANTMLMAAFGTGEANLNATIDSTGFSTINVAGATSFGGGDVFFNLSLGGDFSATLGETFTIISSDSFGLFGGRPVAEFNNVGDGSTIVVDGYSFLAGYDAGDFTLQTTAIPEPGSYALLAGMGALCSIMLRRRRA